jgi:hypothetical protein
MSSVAADAPASGRSWTILFWLTTIASAAPLFAARYLPFTDLPEHVAAMATLSDLAPGGGGASYEIALGDSQYLVYHATGALLTRALGDAILANQLLLAAVAVLWPLSFRSLLRAFERDERIALFAPMLFWSRALAIGFLPFVASVPVALWALALLVRTLREPTPRRWGGLSLLSVVLFYTHASSYLLFGLVTSVMVLARRPHLRVAGALAASLAPSALLALSWWRRGSLHLHHETESVVRMSVGETLTAMPLWTFDMWRSHVDEACAAAWWLAFGVALFIALRRAPKLDRRAALLAAPFVVTLALYFATPFSVGMAGYLNLRLAPLLALFALLWLRPRRDRVSNAVLRLVAVTSCVAALNAGVQVRAAERAHADGLGALLEQVPPGAKLASLNFDARSWHTKFLPYVFAGSYHRARGGAQAGYSFADLPHWSVHHKAGAQPPKWAPHWAYRPCDFSYREGGAYYDYVLVQGDLAPFVDDAPGPRFEPVARARAFTLYRKTGPAPASTDAEPDRSVCAPPPVRAQASVAM